MGKIKAQFDFNLKVKLFLVPEGSTLAVEGLDTNLHVYWFDIVLLWEITAMHESLVVFSVQFAVIDVTAAPNPTPTPTPPSTPRPSSPLFSVLCPHFTCCTLNDLSPPRLLSSSLKALTCAC